MNANVKVQVGSHADGGAAGEHRALGVMAAFFAICLLLGTLLDETIAQALYMPRNVVATIVTTFGTYPFSGAVVLFLGVIFERVVHTMQRVPKIASATIAALAALVLGFLGASQLVDADSLGSLFPFLAKNYPVIAILSLVFEWPLFGLGYLLAGQSDDKCLLKRSVCLVVVFLATFAFLQATKGVFGRPRFRSVALGLEGVGFVPWYTISPDPSELMARYGLAANEFRSFPSGHAILSISTISVLLSLTWLFPNLRDKRLRLMWSGFAFAVIIMACRMLLGAHYLSDVSAGALIGLAFVLINDLLQRRIDKGL